MKIRNKKAVNNDKYICFIGNPNAGKTSFINMLANASLQVANYSGVTVEKKEAIVFWNQTNCHLVDLPGLFSMWSGAGEEQVTIDYLHNEQVDVVVNVIDATNFERGCDLMLELRELQIPMLILLNFQNDAIRQGIGIKLIELQNLLEVKIILCDASDSNVMSEIKLSIIDLMNQDKDFVRHPLYIEENASFLHLQEVIRNQSTSYRRFNEAQISLLALKWCEQDERYLNLLWNLHLPTLENDDIDFIRNYRRRLKQKCLSCFTIANTNCLQFTKILDQILLHSTASIPIFLVIVFLLFAVPLKVTEPITKWCEQFFRSFISYYVLGFLQFIPKQVLSLINSTFILGAGSVLAFMPLLASLYFLLGVLEESGYLARISCLFDRIMRPFGLSGRSIISLMMGVGCHVPAILSTRSMHDSQSKKLTALLIPFVSCSARLPIYILFCSIFFPDHTILVIGILYAIGIWLAMILSIIINRCYPNRNATLFTMELPQYRIPSLKLVIRKMLIECRAFVRKTMTIICSSMMVLHLLSNYPTGEWKGSYLMNISSRIAPVFEPLGFGNRIELIAALPGAVVSKENIIAFLGQILIEGDSSRPLRRTFQYDLRRQFRLLSQALLEGCSLGLIAPMEENTAPTQQLSAKIALLWQDEHKVLRALSYLIYISLCIPCVMTLQAIKREFGNKQLLLSVCIMLMIPYLVSFLVYQSFSFL